MRRLALMLGVLACVTGCKREPTFEERYDAAHASIERTAREIDAQLTGAPPSELPGSMEGNPDEER